VSRAEQLVQQAELSQFYFGYLSDAVTIFENAIMHLKQCDFSQCDISDSTDMAHKIKGNAAMYGYPDLGLKAAKVERVLRSAPKNPDHANVLLSLINLIDDIQAICLTPGKSEPLKLRDTLAADDKGQIWGSQSPAVPVGRKRIILAYRDIWVCELMTSLLEPEFEVTSYHSGKDIQRALQDDRPDLVILEETLEDMSGLDVVRGLKTSSHLNDLSVFIGFDGGAHESIAEAISLGVDGFSEDKHEILEIANFAKKFLNKPVPSILVIDDDPMVRELLNNTLTSGGFKVDTACDGLEGLDYLSNETPDLVLLDRFMPRLEGGTVLYEIQNKINLKSIPVLILTAMANHGEAKSWFERGAADFIPKPFDPEEVLMRVKQHLETR